MPQIATAIGLERADRQLAIAVDRSNPVPLAERSTDTVEAPAAGSTPLQDSREECIKTRDCWHSVV